MDDSGSLSERSHCVICLSSEVYACEQMAIEANETINMSATVAMIFLIFIICNSSFL